MNDRMLVSLVFLSSLCSSIACGTEEGDDQSTFSTFGDAESAAEAAEGADTAEEAGTEGESAADAGDGDGDGDGDAEGEADGGDGDGADGNLSCEECWMSHCSSERMDCEAAADCACILTCVEGGGSVGQCKGECGVQGSDATWNAWVECVDLNCSGAC